MIDVFRASHMSKMARAILHPIGADQIISYPSIPTVRGEGVGMGMGHVLASVNRNERRGNGRRRDNGDHDLIQSDPIRHHRYCYGYECGHEQNRMGSMRMRVPLFSSDPGWSSVALTDMTSDWDIARTCPRVAHCSPHLQRVQPRPLASLLQPAVRSRWIALAGGVQASAGSGRQVPALISNR